MWPPSYFSLYPPSFYEHLSPKLNLFLVTSVVPSNICALGDVSSLYNPLIGLNRFESTTSNCKYFCVKRTSNLKFGNNSRTILTGNHEDFVPALQVPQNRQTVQERSHVLRKYYEKPKVLQQHAGKLEICIRCINRGSQWNDLNILYPLHSWRYKQTVKWRIITFTFKTNTWIFLQRKGLVFSKRSVPYIIITLWHLNTSTKWRHRVKSWS